MANEKSISEEVKKAKVLQESWLHFYNKYLFEKGCISQSEYNKIAVKIRSHTSTPV